MTFTNVRQLIAAGLVTAVIVYAGVRLGYGSLPPLPLMAGATLVLVAIVDGVLALTMGPRAQRKSGTEPLESLSAARAVALAKASSAAGSIMAGLWVGFLAHLLMIRSTIEAARADTDAALIGLVSALILIGAGLWLEYSLRNPDDPEEESDNGA